MPAIGHCPHSIRFKLKDAAIPILHDELAARIASVAAAMSTEGARDPERIETHSNLLLEYRELLQQLAVARDWSQQTVEIHVLAELATQVFPACLAHAIDNLREAADSRNADRLAAAGRVTRIWTKVMAELLFLDHDEDFDARGL